MSRVKALVALGLGFGVPASAAVEPGVSIVSQETLLDPGYSEITLSDPRGPIGAYLIRTWLPLQEREPEAGPVNLLVLIDGQADAGLAAAMARQAETVLADDALLVVTVSPANENVMQHFRRPAWSADERIAMATFLRTTLLPHLSASQSFGKKRLAGFGRGGDVALTAYDQDPAAFGEVHVSDPQLPIEAMPFIGGSSSSAAGSGALRLSWTFGANAVPASTQSALARAKAAGKQVEWSFKESREAFLDKASGR